ncbi:MAG TPA: 2-oxo-4-hydroxy-4-carboxy-5-ureidoimidazoline decarboxylase [Xanthomonadales bacterium]|nr:2-oxo-4-hydroxy-4-carboxy-5-ureidoimidazoline decarboxylase [Xanthomonadales bacterium]
MRLAELNALPREAFVAALGAVFEHSPWVAAAVVDQRPFASVAALHGAMCAAVAAAGDAPQLALIRAHPQLAGKAAIAGDLTAHSRQEQRGAGLDQCSPDEFARIRALNDAYQQRFGFPFIVAVRGLGRTDILAAMEQRLALDAPTERAEALRQIERIAAFRLADMLGEKGDGGI